MTTERQDLLTALAAEAPAESASASSAASASNGNEGGNTAFEGWLTSLGITFQRPHTDTQGRVIYPLVACPFDPSHTNTSAAVGLLPNGARFFNCFHNSCRENRWAQFRARFPGGGSGGDPAGDPSRPWGPPILFDRPRDLPTFPTDALPGWLRAFVEALAVEAQVPVDLPALLALAVVATACAKKFKIVVRAGWTEPLNIFVAVALESGTRKSAVFRAVQAPLTDHERHEATRLAPEIAQARARVAVLAQRLKRAQGAAAKARGKKGADAATESAPSEAARVES